MNGSLPPISRLTRATRSAQTAAILLPVSTEPVKATHSIRSSATIAAPTVAGAGDHVDDPVGQVVEAARGRERRQRRHLGGLADGRVAGGERRRELPGQQQQRVVPGHDAADRADRVLDHQRELARLDRRDHPPGRVAADLGVVVEGGGGPADLVGVLDQGLAALERHQLCELVRPRTEPGRDLVQQLAALDRRGALPPALGVGRGGDRRVELLLGRGADGRDDLLVEGVLDLDLGALAGHPLAADQQPGLDLGHGSMLSRPGSIGAMNDEDRDGKSEQAQQRGESEEERLDRNLMELLQELRVASIGVQFLFAFLLVVPFQQGFVEVTDFEKTRLLRHPAVDRGRRRLPDGAGRPPSAPLSRPGQAVDRHTRRTSTRSPAWGCSALAISGVILLISQYVYDDATAAVATAAIGARHRLGLVRRAAGPRAARRRLRRRAQPPAAPGAGGTAGVPAKGSASSSGCTAAICSARRCCQIDERYSGDVTMNSIVASTLTCTGIPRSAAP